MTITLRILGREVLALTTDEPATDERAPDVTTYPIGFTKRGPYLTDGRYGCEDDE